MNDKTIQKKLDQIVKLSNELHNEAVKRYGPEGNIFAEAEGKIFIMSGDVDGTASERQEFVKFVSNGYCLLGVGAW
jgi:hypothetical protein